MTAAAPNPFRGVVVWLTEDQGGRQSGPPRPPYAATAYVPPETVRTGLASFVVDKFDPTAWRSAAEGRWLIVDNEWPQHIQPGSVVVITEGPKPVGYFHVEQITATEITSPPAAGPATLP